MINFAQSSASTSDTDYHGKKSDIMKRLPPFCLAYLPNKESNAAVIIANVPCDTCRMCLCHLRCRFFHRTDLVVLIFYHLQSLTSSFDRVDLVFDQCFDQSLKKDTRKGRGMGSRFVFTGNIKLLNKIAEDVLMNSANKNDFNDFLAKTFYHLYRGDQIYILSYRDSVLTNHPEKVFDEGISNRKCQSEKADQRVIRTLHCVGQQIYCQIVVRTIDTDVLILLISYLGGFTFYDASAVNVYAEMINSSSFYGTVKIIAFLGPDICKALPFFYAFTECDIVYSFQGKRKCRAWDT